MVLSYVLLGTFQVIKKKKKGIIKTQFFFNIFNNFGFFPKIKSKYHAKETGEGIANPQIANEWLLNF